MSKVALCEVDAMKSGEARRFEGDNYRIALVRIENDFYAVGDKCSHADVSLAQGDVFERECEIECWKHGSVFSLTTGEPQNLPATEPVPVYEVSIENNQVMVEVP